MARTLTVYGVNIQVRGVGQVRGIVAAPSGAAAARALGTTYYHLRGWGSPTGNAGEIAQAMKEPGVAFWTAERYHFEPKWNRLNQPKEGA